MLQPQEVGRSSEETIWTKKFRRDLREHNTPLSALLDEDRTLTSSRHEMKSIKESFHTKRR